MNKEIMRLCALTRQKNVRQSMFRIVKTPNHDIKIDYDYSLKGRGCYLSKDKDVILKAKKRRIIEKNLKIDHCLDIYEQLLKMLDN